MSKKSVTPKEIVAELKARDPRRTGIEINRDQVIIHIEGRGRRSRNRQLQVHDFVRWTADYYIGASYETSFEGPASSASLNSICNWIEKLVERIDDREV